MYRAIKKIQEEQDRQKNQFNESVRSDSKNTKSAIDADFTILD